MNDKIELIIDEFNAKYYVLKNSNLDKDLDKDNKNIINLNVFLKKLNNKFYYKGKLLHRLDGPAIEKSNGDKIWCKNGLRHRENSPAIEYKNGTKSYWFNGLKHREDGPSYESYDGHKEYWINGFKISEEKFYLEKELRESIINNNISKKNKI